MFLLKHGVVTRMKRKSDVENYEFSDTPPQIFDVALVYWNIMFATYYLIPLSV